MDAQKKIAAIKRALEIREELFDIANSLAGDQTGPAAVMLHGACNAIVYAKENVEYALNVEI